MRATDYVLPKYVAITGVAIRIDASAMVSPIDQRARFQLAHFGAALGDPSRAAMLVALMGGVSLPASELAQIAGVTASTATSHLRGLLDAGIVAVRAQGRHRYYKLANQDVASALEQFASLGLKGVPQQQQRSPSEDAIAIARTCYSHLAGRVAVAFWTRARQAGWVAWDDDLVSLLPKGRLALTKQALLVDAPEVLSGRSCLDWSERVPHVAGRLGIAVCDALIAHGWVKRKSNTRALRVTAHGEDGLHALGIRW